MANDTCFSQQKVTLQLVLYLLLLTVVMLCFRRFQELTFVTALISFFTFLTMERFCKILLMYFEWRPPGRKIRLKQLVMNAIVLVFFIDKILSIAGFQCHAIQNRSK